MVAVPLPKVVNNPVGSTVATAVFDEVNVSPVVTACSEPSEYWPLTANGCKTPGPIATIDVGLTEIEVSCLLAIVTGTFTGEIPVPLTVMAVVPVPTAVTMPDESTVTTVVSPELN
jgi:hypothetical protein